MEEHCLIGFYACILLNFNIAYHTTKYILLFKVIVINENNAKITLYHGRNHHVKCYRADDTEWLTHKTLGSRKGLSSGLIVAVKVF